MLNVYRDQTADVSTAGRWVMRFSRFLRTWQASFCWSLANLHIQWWRWCGKIMVCNWKLLFYLRTLSVVVSLKMYVTFLSIQQTRRNVLYAQIIVGISKIIFVLTYSLSWKFIPCLLLWISHLFRSQHSGKPYCPLLYIFYYPPLQLRRIIIFFFSPTFLLWMSMASIDYTEYL